MDSPNRVHLAVNTALMMLLRPLVRLLLRYDVPFSAFEELAKHAYVQAAMKDFALPGKKPTVSRASILTGLTRKDVQRLVAEPEPERAASQEGYNRAARVLSGWARDPAFHTRDGKPATLDAQDALDGTSSFAELVRRYSGDMPARAVLDELLRVGAVHRRLDQRLELVAKAYVPQTGEVEKLGILGSDVSDLITTIDHNLQHGATDARFQRKVMYRNVPTGLRPAFRALSAQQSQALLEHLDAWLSDHIPDDPPGPPDAAGRGEPPQDARIRLGLGIYYFEAPAALDPTKEK